MDYLTTAWETLESLEEATEGKRTPKQEKAFAIMRNIMHTAMAIRDAVPKAYPRKRIFPRYDRTPANRIRKAKAKLALFLMPQMAGIQHRAILAQPMPTYPNGSPGGLPFVGECGPEVFIAPDQNKES